MIRDALPTFTPQEYASYSTAAGYEPDFVFGGLPGTGSTTISRALANCCSASYLRIDVIEQALRSAGVLAGDVGPSGYIIGNALAASNLANGQTGIVDCDNPVGESLKKQTPASSLANTHRKEWCRFGASRDRHLQAVLHFVIVHCGNLIDSDRKP